MRSCSNSLRRARPLLGTLVDIAATGAQDKVPAAIDSAFSMVERIHRLMSFHEAGSDVSRVNAADSGCDVPVDSHTYCVIEHALRLGELSGGIFDIAIAGVLVRNGFLPRQDQIKGPSNDATYRDIELRTGHRLRWRRKGWIDLGGIAKGYAVDCAVASLQAHGMSGGVVNAGGDLRFFGEAQPIHVRHPDAPGSFVSLGSLTDCAVATSSGYFSGRALGDGVVEPLVDPQRKICVGWQESVTVIASDCMTADALTKVVRLDKVGAPEVLAGFNAQAIVIDRDGMRRFAGNLAAGLPAQ